MSELITIEGFSIGNQQLPKYVTQHNDPVPVPVMDGNQRIMGRKTRKVIINPTLLSAGELSLKLLAQRNLIKSNYYGDPQGIYQANRDIIALAAKDLHNFNSSHLTGSVPEEVKGVVKAILAAKKQTQKAATVRSIRGVAGFDPFGDDPLFTVQSVCRPIQLQLQAKENELFNHPLFDDRFLDHGYNGSIPSAIRKIINQANQLSDDLQACQGNGHLINLMNDKLENAAHDFMYAYFTNNDVNSIATNVVANKAFYQKTAVAKLAHMIGVTDQNLAFWLENGIMRQNVVHGAEPLGGRSSAYAVKYKYDLDHGNQVGVPFVVVAPWIVKILGALTAAIVAANALINGLQPDQYNQLTNNIPPPGSPIFNPNKDDFDDQAGNGGEGGGDDDEGNNTGLLLGGIAAGLFLLTRK